MSFFSASSKPYRSFVPLIKKEFPASFLLDYAFFFLAGLIAELSDSNTMAVWKSTKVMVQLPVLQLSVFEYAFPNGLYIVCVDGSGINTWLALIRCIET